MKGLFARINPAESGKGPFGGYPVHVDATSSDGDAEFELTQPDGLFTLTHVKTGHILSADATQYAEDLCKQYSTRPASQRGAYESFNVCRTPVGTLICYIEYKQDGRQYTSAPLCWVKK